MRIWTICDLVRKLLSAIFSLPLLDLIFLYLGRKPRYPCSTGLLLWCAMHGPSLWKAAASVWFETWGSWIRV